MWSLRTAVAIHPWWFCESCCFAPRCDFHCNTWAVANSVTVSLFMYRLYKCMYAPFVLHLYRLLTSSYPTLPRSLRIPGWKSPEKGRWNNRSNKPMSWQYTYSTYRRYRSVLQTARLLQSSYKAALSTEDKHKKRVLWCLCFAGQVIAERTPCHCAETEQPIDIDITVLTCPFICNCIDQIKQISAQSFHALAIAGSKDPLQSIWSGKVSVQGRFCWITAYGSFQHAAVKGMHNVGFIVGSW